MDLNTLKPSRQSWRESTSHTIPCSVWMPIALGNVLSSLVTCPAIIVSNVNGQTDIMIIWLRAEHALCKLYTRMNQLSPMQKYSTPILLLSYIIHTLHRLQIHIDEYTLYMMFCHHSNPLFFCLYLMITRIIFHTIAYVPTFRHSHTFVINCFACSHKWIINYFYILSKYFHTHKYGGVLGYPTRYPKWEIPFKISNCIPLIVSCP